MYLIYTIVLKIGRTGFKIGRFTNLRADRVKLVSKLDWYRFDTEPTGLDTESAGSVLNRFARRIHDKNRPIFVKICALQNQGFFNVFLMFFFVFNFFFLT